MSAYKPSFFKYLSYTGNFVEIHYQCSDCFSATVYRHKSMYKLTFLEGHFHCIGCKKEVDYTSEDFISKEQKKAIQLTMQL